MKWLIRLCVVQLFTVLLGNLIMSFVKFGPFSLFSMAVCLAWIGVEIFDWSWPDEPEEQDPHNGQGPPR